jgi:hypothetical protein
LSIFELFKNFPEVIKLKFSVKNGVFLYDNFEINLFLSFSSFLFFKCISECFIKQKKLQIISEQISHLFIFDF